ncbi:MAG: LysM peptidoglycan-binding domain-containing protein, partial [Leptolyngbyaceae bacterium]|nr:LysM peptidoglycan-binding domain-containing protein [Leptolyngbyaceae bacterium]
MKRAFPQNVESVSSPSLDEAGEGQPQMSSEVNRRACTSAAMIGLAISMGASSLLVPRQSDSAIAAEPLATETESPIATTPVAFEVATLASTPEVESSTAVFPPLSSSITEHAVQKGQTLWHIAQLYRVDTLTLASSNNITVDSVLHIGQILKIPVATQASATLQTKVQDVKSLLKDKQGIALSHLKQRPSEQRPSELISSAAKLNTFKSSFPDLEPESSSSTVSTLPEFSKSEVAYQFSTQPTLSDSVEVPILAPKSTIASRVEVSKDDAVASQPEILVPDTRLPKLEVANAKELNPVQVAMVIKPEVPVPAQAVLPAAPITHRVKSGDTLAKIAQAYNVSLASLVATNRISDPDLIFVDQRIRVPQAQAPAQKTQSAEALQNTTKPTLVALSSSRPVLPSTLLAVPGEPTKTKALDIVPLNNPTQPEITQKAESKFKGS